MDYPDLVGRLRTPLMKYVSGIVHDPASTEDIVQETFLRVLRHLHRFRRQASIKTWIFSIARNLCLDALRAARRSRIRLLESFSAAAADSSPRQERAPDSLCTDPVLRLDLDERRARVGRALAGLSPEARNLLVLRVYLGLSYREIARRCRVPPDGVGTRISRALQGLSRRLA